MIGENPNTEIGTNPEENVCFSSNLRKHWFNAQSRSKANAMKGILLLLYIKYYEKNAEGRKKNHIDC